MIGRLPCCCLKRVDSADVLLRTCAISHSSQKTGQKSSTHIAHELITQTQNCWRQRSPLVIRNPGKIPISPWRTRCFFFFSGSTLLNRNTGSKEVKPDYFFWRLDLYIVGKTKNKVEKDSRNNKVEPVFTSWSVWLCDCRTQSFIVRIYHMYHDFCLSKKIQIDWT